MALFDQAQRDACHGALMGMPASIKESTEPHTVAMEERAVGLQNVGNDPDGVGELVVGGENFGNGLFASVPWPISRLLGERRISLHHGEGGKL